jgi:uncharacterized protein YecA (UPF0149 family)
MGIIADSIVAYAQPLIDQSDGSLDGMQRALTLAQMCWNLAVLPEKERDAAIAELRQSFHMDDGEFEDFRQSIIVPMIRRHHEMFPRMQRPGSLSQSIAPIEPRTHTDAPFRAEKHFRTGRNDPCPCNSGKKYKHCCGRKPR